MKTENATSGLLLAGAGSYPQAFAAINEFRLEVQRLIREVVEENLGGCCKFNGNRVVAR